MNQKISTGLGTAIIIVMAFTAGYFVWIIGYKNQQQFGIPRVAIPQLTTTVVSPTVPSPSQGTNHDNSINKACVLLRTKDGISQPVLSSTNCYHVVARWKNLIFFSEGDGYVDKNISLISFNLDTGEKTPIYNLDENKQYFREPVPYGISSIKVLRDKLFFSVGGYMTNGAIYSFALPFDGSKPKLIVMDDQYYSIEERDNHYWVVGGIGDAGVSIEKRALFDFTDQTIGKPITTSQDMGSGERFLGADEVHAFIGVFENEPSSDNDEVSFLNKLVRVYTIDLGNLGTKKDVLKRSEIPEGIRDAIYLREKNQILLLGHTVYLYGLDEKKQLSLMNVDKADDYYGLRISGSSLCMGEHQEINIEQRTIFENAEHCPGLNGDNLRENFPALHLPVEYSLQNSPN